jgi:cyclopropane fatty-acyl-phospholipid synthase-like methyltransferase
MGLKDSFLGNQSLLNRALHWGFKECWNLFRMRSYWNSCAQENARKHIAIDDWESEEDFHRSGLRDIQKILASSGVTLAQGSRVLEIGCGIGRLLKPLAMERRDLEIYGVDVSTEMIQQGKERLSDVNNIYLAQVNGKDLSLFENEFFDFIFSYVTFQHIPRRYLDDIFGEVHRVLKKKGIFTFQMQFREDNPRTEPPENDYRTIRYYTTDMLHTMCNRAGFRVLTVEKPRKKEGYLYTTVTK